MSSITSKGQSFHDGDEVYHRAWDITGTVIVFDNVQPGEAEAEVQWDDVNVADELDLVADQLEILS